MWLVRKVRPPFVRSVRRSHKFIASKANGLVEGDDEMYFGYDQFQNKYIIATPHHRNDPDDYQIGHTAGKVAMLLGAIPVFAGMVALEVFSAAFEYLPEHWLVTLLALGIMLSIAFFLLVAMSHWLTMGVDMQNTAENRQGASP